MEPGEESVVAPPPPPPAAAAAARRRGRRAVQVVDVDEDDSEIDVDDDDDDDDDEEEDVLLAPAKPTDLFVWHSQSQGMSQCGSQLTEVEGTGHTGARSLLGLSPRLGQALKN